MPAQTPTAISCPTCNARIFSGEIIKQTTVLKVFATHTEAKCKCCKTWVRLPLILAQPA